MRVTMAKISDKRCDVRHGGYRIDFILHIDARIPGGSGWRFIANRKDYAARMPAPAPVFATAEDTLADLSARLA